MCGRDGHCPVRSRDNAQPSPSKEPEIQSLAILSGKFGEAPFAVKASANADGNGNGLKFRKGKA